MSDQDPTRAELLAELAELRRRLAALEPGRNSEADQAAHHGVQEPFDLLETFIDAIPNPIFFKNIQGQYLGCNRAFELIMDLSREDLVGKSVYDISPHHLAEVYFRKDQELFDQPGIQIYEALIHSRSRGSKEVIFHKATFKDENGQVAGLVGVIFDVTEIKQTQTALTRANRALMTLSQCNEALIHASDEFEFFHQVCRIIVETGGYSLAWVVYAEEGQDQDIRSVAQAGGHDGLPYVDGPSWSESARILVGQALESGRVTIERCPLGEPGYLARQDLARARGYAAAIALPLYVEGSVHGVLSIYAAESDAFDQEETKLLANLADSLAYAIMAMRARAKKAEAEEVLRRSSQELELRVWERTAQLARINRELQNEITQRAAAEEALTASANKFKGFAYSIVHDLKSPTTAIFGLTRKLTRDYGTVLDEKAKSYCNQILKASEHVAALVDKINLYITAKEAPLRIEQVNLQEILDIVKEEFSSRFAIRQVEWIQPLGEIEVLADRVSLIRVFRNLVDNALKYGGQHLARLTIGYDEVPDHHLLSVNDDGEGIGQDDSEKIFGLFQRRDSSQGIQGSGLGLAIVREIVERHGGRIWVESGTPRGVTFFLTLSKGG
jgi:PAS domain S-box-containing protein